MHRQGQMRCVLRPSHRPRLLSAVDEQVCHLASSLCVLLRLSNSDRSERTCLVRSVRTELMALCRSEETRSNGHSCRRYCMSHLVLYKDIQKTILMQAGKQRARRTACTQRRPMTPWQQSVRLRSCEPTWPLWPCS